MTLRLYLDEDTIDKDLVQALRTQNIDFITISEAGLEGASDEDQLQYATVQGRVLYSFNIKHYTALSKAFLQQGRSHAGIILAEQHRRFSVGEQMRRLIAIATTLSDEEIRDQIVFLSAWG